MLLEVELLELAGVYKVFQWKVILEHLSFQVTLVSSVQIILSQLFYFCKIIKGRIVSLVEQ